MLEAEVPDLDEVKAAVADIVSDDARAGDTIQRLRALFRREELAHSEIDVAQLLTEVRRIIRSDAIFARFRLISTYANRFAPCSPTECRSNRQ